jgi:hypothetical protein
MKKIKFIIAAVAMLSLVSSSAVYADGFAPGEGLYIGAFAGIGTGVVQPKVTTQGTSGTAAAGGGEGRKDGGTFEATEGGLGLAGSEGGTWIGYGYKMGDLYAGLEGEAAWGDVEFKLTSSTGIELDIAKTNITSVTATKDWTSGFFGRIGYYINPSALLSFRGGILASKFDVAYTGQSETFYAGGPSFGVSLESTLAAIDPNLNLRMDTVYTDYLTSPISGIGTNTASSTTNLKGHDSEITGSALSARIGLTYSFFDVNSLF